MKIRLISPAALLLMQPMVFASPVIETPPQNQSANTSDTPHTALEQQQAQAATTTITTPPSAEFAVVPFAFSSESLSTALGAAGVVKHAGQEQASILGIGLYSANDSWVGYLGAHNYQIPAVDSWLFSIETYQAQFKEGIYYLSELAAPNQDAAKVVTLGDESFTRFHAKYVLPWGRGVNGAAPSLASSAEAIGWNPLTSGVTSIKVSPFVQTRELHGYEYLPQKSQGVALKLDWDNRDNGKNSTQGGQTSLKFSRDFGAADRSSWTTWEFEQSAFFAIGANDWFAQQVMAFNFYLADTPTWNAQSGDNYHRPPTFAGISLGGFDRLRGYASKRFTGRSAVLYSAEYRIQPRWQPLQQWPLFNLYDVPWWQWVAFAEAGQTADEFDAQLLHDDLQWTAGIGARFEVESIVVRAELAFGSEDSQFWVMVNQPF
ncbi:outer membrane protein assembly factor [Shewanella abyssi]|uniref:outer membrane protein assembly factor n=1 Tax=Shewanella abyssi TaxID=311789 RepID=UPI00200D05A5|nr:outer membrane protein assembly factor [Shewanella abyssi]MCL1048709.1 outer membrane protein assembly factor [Shewanella abyssi]